MRETRKILWFWLKKKVSREISEEAVHKLFSKKNNNWFFAGRYDENDPDKCKSVKGSETSKLKWIQIRTALVGDNDKPILWGMEVVHPDSEIPGRYWATSVSLELNPEKNTVRCITAIRKYLKYYYIGESIKSDPHTSPRFIADIIRDFRCICNNTPIYKDTRDYTKQYNSSDLKYLRKNLADSQRRLPYILIIQPDETSEELEKFKKELRKQTRGNANVFVLSKKAYEVLLFYGRDEKTLYDRTLFDDLTEKLPLATVKKRSKVFVLCSLPKKYEGHYLKRYDEINEQTLSEIFCAVSRYSRGEPRDLVSFQSVVTKQKVLEHIRITKENRELRETKKKFEEDNKELSEITGELQEEVDSYQNELNTYLGELDRYMRANDDLSGLKERLNTKVNELTTTNNHLKYSVQELEQSKRELSEIFEITRITNQKIQKLLGVYVESLASQLKLASEIFCDRIEVLEQAYESANSYDKKFSNGPDFYERSWQMLQALAITLYDCYTLDEPKNIEQRFKDNNKTPEISFTMNEGRQTNKNSRLSKEREIDYEGKKESMASHLKLGSDKKALRLHLFYDKDKRKIVVGYWGKHMATAASGKGGERK